MLIEETAFFDGITFPIVKLKIAPHNAVLCHLQIKKLSYDFDREKKFFLFNNLFLRITEEYLENAI
ncbi:hypothetical protein [Neobacillus drentensis]|uniref:hypothetical protein n=1 Tax=Neobacillus drentensis TaxID=220684 RepID=UPI003001F290